MNRIIKTAAFLLIMFAIFACSDDNPCSNEVKYLQWKEYRISMNDTAETFYGHVMKVLDIEINTSIVNDTVYSPADTIYSDNDTTYIPADTTITSDTLTNTGKVTFELYSPETEVESEENVMNVDSQIEYGIKEFGSNYSHILIYLAGIDEETLQAIFRVRNSELYQDCSNW